MNIYDISQYYAVSFFNMYIASICFDIITFERKVNFVCETVHMFK